MSEFDYINRTYDLSIKRGSRVEYGGDDDPKLGSVTHADGQYIFVRFDGSIRPRGPFHPTWKMRYIGEPQP